MDESLLDLFIFETTQNIEQLEQIILESEKSKEYSSDEINEIFRIMHTIKGSAAMMMFGNISSIAHSVEDLFYFIRGNNTNDFDYSDISDIVFESLDFIKNEMERIKKGEEITGDESPIVSKVLNCLKKLKDKGTAAITESPKVKEQVKTISLDAEEPVSKYSDSYRVLVIFEEGCQMESIRAFSIIHKLSEFAHSVRYVPEDIIDNDNSAVIIREKGFEIFFKSDKPYDELHSFFSGTIFVSSIILEKLNHVEEHVKEEVQNKNIEVEVEVKETTSAHQVSQPTASDVHSIVAATIINVNVSKLDKLMDLVGEMVISEAMVTQNPDLKGLELDNFKKAARQLHKITSEIQDIVMSIRMVPLAEIFQKMHRIVRDMSKKLNKEVKLDLVGEETEVDKNIIKHLSDPLMHLVRNSIDHGIESTEQRVQAGKPSFGTVTLEAKNVGSDVLVVVRDDGKGLNKEKILNKARQNNLLIRPESEMTEKEIYNLVFLPGFSTNEKITEFSGRGVGMDVVLKNIEAVGGTISVDSVENAGTTFTMKIPLTLAIIDGMNIRVGNSSYTIPTTAIKQSFRPKANDLIQDPDGNEMIMVRGQCYSILRLHEYFKVNTQVTDFNEGILIMIEQYEKTVCIFADELVGQQEVVVKALPTYIKTGNNINGIAGCTLLGDGSISLILDIGTLVNVNGTKRGN